ncbi:DarT ssDNA thymidine ADP-ribosyltransferase family protein [Rhodococcus sp. IEGM1428]|uniref:DarT ssDNA thymidine ADP-ribosyltransferase family protein n=1 Tax=Rhodococcus sp. IEGM1428 TaxID=3392191 RepID=UPI003D0F0131
MDIPPGGCVADYIPLYFAPRSPMLYSLKMGNVPTFQGDTHDFVYIVTSTEVSRPCRCMKARFLWTLTRPIEGIRPPAANAKQMQRFFTGNSRPRGIARPSDTGTRIESCCFECYFVK